MTDWSALDWKVYHAIQDLDRRGIYPSGDRLLKEIDEFPPAHVLRTRLRFLASGSPTLTTRDDRGQHEHEVKDTDAFADPHPLPHCESDPDPGVAGRRVSAEARAFNIALYRIVQGEDGTVGFLQVITGLSEDSIKQRVSRVRHEYPPEELDRYAGRLNPDEERHYLRLYSKSSDPVIQEFLQTHCTPRRQQTA